MCSIPVNYEGRTAVGGARAHEASLVAAAVRGDTAAFETLAIRHKRVVMAITRRMTGSLDEAEDLTQQALMKAFANISRFGARCSFSTWLISIAMNEARMWLRRGWKSREVTMCDLCTDEDLDMPVEFMDSRPGPEARCSENERKRLLLSELEQLTPAARVTLQLCDLEEQSSEEAAPTLGITANAVKSRRHRARAILRKRLEAKFISSKGPGAAEAPRQQRSQRQPPRVM
ncbi:MAG: RNA polymerase sigma factor [Acidobacteriaceae bacterium]